MPRIQIRVYFKKLQRPRNLAEFSIRSRVMVDWCRIFCSGIENAVKMRNQRKYRTGTYKSGKKPMSESVVQVSVLELSRPIDIIFLI